MANSWFRFKQFMVQQDQCAMKVTTDACLFGAWVAGQLANEEAPPQTILDIGAGTGLLTLMLAQAVPSAIDAIEKDSAAAKQATANCSQSPWSTRIRITEGDVLHFSPGKKYDCIISNPPFYENELKGSHKAKNLAHHDEGLLFTDLLRLLPGLLQTDGRFFLMIPYKRGQELIQMLKKASLPITAICLVRESTEHAFSRILLAGKLQETPGTGMAFEEINIRGADGTYTTAFTRLLKAYYLKL